MATYIILTRLFPEAFQEPTEFKQLAEKVSAKIKKDCPGVNWRQSYVTLGRYDVIDVVDADEPKEVERAAMIIRAYGHAITETLPATPWKQFLADLGGGEKWQTG